MLLSATELFTLAPLGAYVVYSDGTPKPPARFVNKMRKWENNNSWGYFIKAARDKHDGGPNFWLQQDHGHVIFNRHFNANTNTLKFEVTLPAPGTILAYGDFGGIVEIRHVWRDLNAARTWAHGFYKFANCGLKYFLVGETGELIPDYMPAD